MHKMPKVTVKCGNQSCGNEAAIVHEICGSPLISYPDEKCDYLNYASLEHVASLQLIFLLPSIPNQVMEQLQEDQEIYIDLNGLKSINNSDSFFRQNYSSDFGQLVSSYLCSLLLSWVSTFGIPSKIVPDPNQSDRPKFDSFVITLEGDKIQVAIEVKMYLQSHQYDMLEWYAKKLAKDLMDQDDLVWVHEGDSITLSDVDPFPWSSPAC